MQNEIDIRELRDVTNKLFDHLIDDLQLSKLIIKNEEDYYWDIAVEDAFQIEKKKPEIDVGRLSDDWGFLRPLLTRKDMSFPLMFIHLAPILRYMGGKIRNY